MKKFWWLIFIFFLVIIILPYLLIPTKIVVNKIIYIDKLQPSIARYLHNNDNMQQWLNGKPNKQNEFIYENSVYKPGIKSQNSLDIVISDTKNSYNSLINILPFGLDSSAVQWEFQFTASNNPLKRVVQYKNAKRIRNNMTDILSNFKKASENLKNIYGFDIRKTTISDTALVSIKINSKQYPSTKVIYDLIAKLQLYVKQHHATEHNYPMLNITQNKDSIYIVRVGIPTNILLPGNNIIEPKRMIMLKDETLKTEVIGDVNTVNKALKATSDYMDDYQLSSPVIPFQQLVTDRSKQSDSTKWITCIFTPVT